MLARTLRYFHRDQKTHRSNSSPDGSDRNCVDHICDSVWIRNCLLRVRGIELRLAKGRREEKLASIDFIVAYRQQRVIFGMVDTTMRAHQVFCLQCTYGHVVYSFWYHGSVICIAKSRSASEFSRLSNLQYVEPRFVFN